MCGNGIRCVAKYLAELENTREPKSYKVLTGAGYMTVELHKDGQVCGPFFVVCPFLSRPFGDRVLAWSILSFLAVEIFKEVSDSEAPSQMKLDSQCPAGVLLCLFRIVWDEEVEDL
jgi:hypothetical protein